MVVVSNDPYGTGKLAAFNGKAECLEQKNCPSSNDASSLPQELLTHKSVTRVLELLTEGIKQQNIPIVKQCIANLDQRLNQINTLIIFAYLPKCTMPTNNNYEPTAPPLHESTDLIQDLIQNLRHNCLLEIDKHADYVLKQSEILQLTYNDLLSIIERDTLNVSNESIVYATMYKWGVNECQRRNLNENDLSNLRNVLQQIQYCPRYGLMSKNKFMSKIIEGIPGPTRSGILSEKDWRLVKFYIEDKAKSRPVKDLPHKWSIPRGSYRNNVKRHSSTCSSSRVIGPNKTACERCIINFLSCWTAVFD